MQGVLPLNSQIILQTSEEYQVEREFVCIVCPNSCELVARECNNSLQVSGNRCDKGVAFAEQEVYNPQRVLTSTVKLSTGKLLPVRSSGAVKKGELKTLVRSLRSVSVTPPVEIGQIIVSGAGENSVDIVASDSVGRY